MDALQYDPHVLPPPPQQITIHSTRPNRLEYDSLVTPKGLKHSSGEVKSSQHGFKWVNNYCADMVFALMLYIGQSYDSQYLIKPLLTPDFEL